MSQALSDPSCVCVLVTQSCPTLCDPRDCSPPGSFVRGILQARILEWVAISFSRSFICVILSNCITPVLVLSWENWVYETIWNFPKTTQHVHESCDFNLSPSATQTLPSYVAWWVSRLATSEIKALVLFKHKFPQEDTYYNIVFLRFEYCADPHKIKKSSNILKFQSFVCSTRNCKWDIQQLYMKSRLFENLLPWWALYHNISILHVRTLSPEIHRKPWSRMTGN